MGQSNRNTSNAKTNGNSRKQKVVWDVDDIRMEKRKIRVQSKNKKRKRAGQMKVYSHQETVVYFPKTVNESTNRD